MLHPQLCSDVDAPLEFRSEVHNKHPRAAELKYEPSKQWPSLYVGVGQIPFGQVEHDCVFWFQ